MSRNAGAILRLCALTLVAVGIWFAARTYNGLPAPLGLDAPTGSFSAARAEVILERILGPEIPHPTGSAENANVRARIQSEFAQLDVKTTIYSGLACNSGEQNHYIACATVNDIVADVVPGDGKAIILMAHYDSVPAGPGSADDASGVATIIETVRALKARGVISRHPVLAVLTDGEEAGLIGATLFLDNPELKARVGVVVNVEARGSNGPSLLFQTSPGDGKLIDLYADASGYAAGSLFPEIYRHLPNDTDLTPFIAEGFAGFNFAYIGGVSHYHTPLDRREHINRSTIQHQGENVLGVVSALEHTAFSELQGDDDIYLSVFGRWLPRMPVRWAMPLSLATFGIVLTALLLWGGVSTNVGRQAAALGIPPLIIAGCVLSGFVIHSLASFVAHQPDPSYAHPAALRVALTLAVLSIAFFCARLSDGRTLALAAWFWMSILAIAAAALAPGLTPYFLFPALIGTPILLACARLNDPAREVLLFIATLPALVVWITVAALGEDLSGLSMHPLFTVPAALAAMTVAPLFSAAAMSRAVWSVACVSTGIFAIVGTALAGTQPAYSATAPQRLNINLVDDHSSGRAMWTVETSAPLPASLRSAAQFSENEGRMPYAGAAAAYVASAGPVRFAVPDATAAGSMIGTAWHVALTLQGSLQADDVFVTVPGDSGLQAVEIGGKRFEPAGTNRPTVIHYLGVSRSSQSLGLVFDARKTVDLTVAEQRYGLPPDAMNLVRARSNLAVPSQTGDSTIIMEKVSLR